ncbi:MAG TPA: aldo/keto reductase [Actinobacteria bacterium]|nr:aldo/keto reductase [Actinomycetota bacterium]
MPQRAIGDLLVSAVGVGGMPMSFPGMLDKREQAVATIHRALDLGVTLIDTANIYAPSARDIGHNEMLVAEALRTYTGSADLSAILVASKGGITRESGGIFGSDSSPAGLRAACEKSLVCLEVSQIQLYQHHRPDPELDYADQMRTLLSLKEAGLVARIGLSNASKAQIDIAIGILGGPKDNGVVSVQNQFSPRFREHRDALDHCSDLGIAYLPWSPLGGSNEASEVGSKYKDFAEVGAEVGATAQETTLAWLLAMSPVVIPIPGATKPATVDSIVKSATVELSAVQQARLDATTPA